MEYGLQQHGPAHSVLAWPTAEMHQLRDLLTVDGRFPSRRTWERRLHALPDRLPAQIGCLSRYLVALIQPWAQCGRVAALSSTWQRAPVWFHGDIAAGNLLLTAGRLSAVIDWGTSGVGDPACDLAIAWTLFRGQSRAVFKAVLPLDDATWTRGRG